MAATVDERIVAAKFDASDFEKGVNKTIKKLDELKKSMNFKEATKSVKELAEKTEVSTNSMSNSLEKLTDRFTNFTGMIKQKILSGLADEFANVFLRMEQSVKNFITGISTQQIGAGLDKYQQILTSVRVMVSNGVSEDAAYGAMEDLRSYADQTSYSITQMTDALSKMVSAGLEGKDGLETATKAVQGIANACANAGINAQDAGRAFFNLSQAYSKGKLEYNDYRSLELLNMTTAEFKKELMEAAVEVGTLKKVSEGVYKITEKVKAKGAKGKTVNEKNLTDMLRYDWATNAVMNKFFGKYYFSEKEMEKIYEDLGTDKYNANEQQKAKALEIAKEQYGELAVKAYLAAREARSFTDVINTLKDAVSSGWAQTFEYLFGKLEAAKDFFTELTEGPFAECIYMVGEYRNRVLGMWAGAEDTGGGKVFRDTILNITKALGILFRTFLQILPGFNEVGDETDETEEKFQNLSIKLFQLTQRIGEFAIKLRKGAEDFNKFMNSPAFEDGPTRIELIRNILSNLLSIVGVAGRVFGIALHAISRALWSLEPLFDTLLVIFNKVTESFVDLKNNEKVFKDLEYSIDNITNIIHTVLGPLEEVAGFIGEIAKFFLDMSIGTVTESISFFSDFLALLMEIFVGKSAQMENGVGILDSLREEFEGIKKACEDGLGAVKEFFGALLSDIKTLLGLNEEAGSSDKKTGGVFAGLTNFFKTNKFVEDAKNWVNNAIIDVGDFIKSIPSRVKAFGANIYNTLYNLFFEEKRVKDVDENGKTTFKSTQVLTPLGEWLDGVIKDVKAFILDLPNKIIAGVGKVGNWIDELFNEWFGKRTAVINVNDGNGTGWKKQEVEISSKFDNLLYNIQASIRLWFDDLPNKIQKGIGNIGNFFSRVINVIDEFLFGKKQTRIVRERDETGKLTGNRKVITTRVKTGFSKWLDGIIVEVKKFIANIPKYIKAGIKGAGDLISTIINAIFGKKDDKEVTNKDVQEELEKPFLGIDISNIINSLKEIGLEIFNQIARIFTGSDKLEENQEWFSTGIANGIRWIRTKAEEALKWVLEFITTLPSKIAAIFTDENKNENNAEASGIGSEIIKFGKMIGKFLIEDLPLAVLGIVNGAVGLFDTVWTALYNQLVGTGEDSNKEITEYAENEMGYPVSYSHRQSKTAWEKFVEGLGSTISNIWSHLPTWIAEGIHVAIDEIDKLVSSATDWLSGIGISSALAEAGTDVGKEAVKGAEDAGKQIVEQTKEEIANSADAASKDADEEPALVTAIKGIGESLKRLFVTTLPTFFQSAWKELSAVGSEVWTGFVSIFTGASIDDKNHPIAYAVNQFCLKIKKFIIEDVPNAIKDAVTFISNLFSGNKKPVFIDTVLDPRAEQKAIRQMAKQVSKDTKEESPDLFSAISGMFESLFSEDGLLSGNVGQKILDFFLITVPKYVGKAIGFMLKEVPKWLNNVQEGINEALGKANSNGSNEEQTSALESVGQTVTDVGETVLNFFKTVDWKQVTGDAAIIAGLLVVVKILELIKDITKIATPLESWANKTAASNTIEAVFKRAMTLLIVGMAFAAYAANMDEDQFAKAKEILTIIKDLATTLMSLYTIGTGINAGAKAITGVTDAIVAVHDADKKLGSSPKLTGIDKFGDKLASAGGTLAKGGAIAGSISLIGSATDSILDEIMNNFNTIGSIFAGLAENIKNAVEQLESVAGKIDIALEVMGKAVQIAEKFPVLAQYKGDAIEASETLTGISGGLANIVNALSTEGDINKSIESLDSLIGFKDKMSDFVAFVNSGSTFDDFKFAVASLGSALTLFSTGSGTYNPPEKGFISKLVDAVSEMVGNDEFVGLFDLLKGKSFPTAQEAYQTAESMIIFTGSLKQLANAASGMSEQTGKDINGFIKAVGEIDMTPLSGEDGEITTKADQLARLANAIGVFADNTSGLTKENVQTAEYAINVLSQLATSIKKAGQGFLEKAFLGESNLDTFSTGIRNVGNALGDFFKAVEGLDDNNKTPIKHDYRTLEVAGILVQDLAYAMRIFGVNDKAINPEKVQKCVEKFSIIADNLKSFLTAFNDPENWDNGGFDSKQFTFIETAINIFSKMANLVSTISSVEHMQEKMNDFYEMAFGSYNPHGKAMDGTTKHGFFYTMENILIAFGSFYHGIKDENNKFGFTDKDITGFYNSVAQMFKAMSYMTSVGFGVTDNDSLSRDYEFSVIVDSYKNIVDIIRYFNDNMDVITTFLTNVATYDASGVKVAGYFFGALGDLARAMNLFADMSSINHGLMNLKSFDWKTLSDIVGHLITAFDVNVLKAENQAKLESVGETIANKIFIGIQNAFNEDQSLRPVITPVLNLDPMRQQLQDTFGTDMTSGVNWEALAAAVYGSNGQTDDDRIRASELNSKLDLINASIKSGPEGAMTAQDLVTAFASTKIWIDKERLVGEISPAIDEALGRRIFLLNYQTTR